MHEIDMSEMSEEFFACWMAAGNHLSRQVDDGINSWLRSHPHPPFLEHLSFRLGNQLFFVQVKDVDGRVVGPGNSQGHIIAAGMAKGCACVLPMRKIRDSWAADMPGWGLIDATTKRPIDPVSLVTDQKIEMSPWEVHDMSVQIVRQYLVEQGYTVTSWQGNPDVDPSIWFRGEGQHLHWVVVRAARYPSMGAARPQNWVEMEARLSKGGTIGHFASVAVASAEQPFQTSGESAVPLWRGHAMNIRFTGLE